MENLQRRTEELSKATLKLQHAAERSALADQAAERAAANQELSQQLSQALRDLTACEVSTQALRQSCASNTYLCITLL